MYSGTRITTKHLVKVWSALKGVTPAQGVNPGYVCHNIIRALKGRLSPLFIITHIATKHLVKVWSALKGVTPAQGANPGKTVKPVANKAGSSRRTPKRGYAP
jgi:hypothetical protein